MTKSDAIYLSYFLFPFAIPFICVGVFSHIKTVTQNHLIDLRTRTFSSVSIDVNKFIIREYKRYHSSGKGTGAYNDFLYHTYVDVDYHAQGKVIKSFGKLTTHKSIEAAVEEYERLPNRPPLCYQQWAEDLSGTQNEVVSFLSKHQFKPPFNTEKFVINYSPQQPEVNSIITIAKDSYGGCLIAYGLGLLVLGFFVFFCYLGKCIEGVISPLLVCAAIILAFALVVKSTYKVSIDRKAAFVAGFEKQIN